MKLTKMGVELKIGGKYRIWNLETHKIGGNVYKLYVHPCQLSFTFKARLDRFLQFSASHKTTFQYFDSNSAFLNRRVLCLFSLVH
jgi:hypothetical protein